MNPNGPKWSQKDLNDPKKLKLLTGAKKEEKKPKKYQRTQNKVNLYFEYFWALFRLLVYFRYTPFLANKIVQVRPQQEPSKESIKDTKEDK